MLRVIKTVILFLSLANIINSHAFGGDQLLPVKQALINKLRELTPRLDNRLAQPITDVQQGMIRLAPSSTQRGVIAVNDASILVLWDISLKALKHYMDLSKSLVTINQMLISDIQEQQAAAPNNPPNVNPQVLGNNHSQELISRLSILTDEMKLMDNSTQLIDGLQRFMGLDATANPAIKLTQDLTVITLWNYTLDRLKNYIDLVDALTRLQTELAAILNAPITLSANDLKEMGFDVLNLPGFLRKCFEGACHFVSSGRWGRSTEQFTRDVNAQRDERLTAIASEIITILKKNNPTMRKKAMIAWLTSARELSTYLDRVNDYVDRAIKQKPDATADELLNLMRQLKQQDDEEEERRRREESSSHDDEEKGNRPASSEPARTDIPSASDSETKTTSREQKGSGWSSFDERAFQAGNQFDRDMPSGREITDSN